MTFISLPFCTACTILSQDKTKQENFDFIMPVNLEVMFWNGSFNYISNLFSSRRGGFVRCGKTIHPNNLTPVLIIMPLFSKLYLLPCKKFLLTRCKNHYRRPLKKKSSMELSHFSAKSQRILPWLKANLCNWLAW